MGDQIDTIDYTDDWMNPPPRLEQFVTRPKYPRFLIMRKRQIEYYPYTEWVKFREFGTPDDRNKAMALLQAKHPKWRIQVTDELRAPLSYN
jgi:hypothetical protein